MRISPELEAAMIAAGATVRGVNGQVLVGPVVDLTPPPDGCDEKSFQQRVIDVATGLGWERVIHPFNSRRSEPGQPDCIFGRAWGEIQLLVAELKVPPRKPTQDQTWWLKRYEFMKIPAYVWYPSDWAEIVAVLRMP